MKFQSLGRRSAGFKLTRARLLGHWVLNLSVSERCFGQADLFRMTLRLPVLPEDSIRFHSKWGVPTIDSLEGA